MLLAGQFSKSMAVSEDDFNRLSDEQKWALYSRASVDSAAFEALTKQVKETLTALQTCKEKVVKLEGQLKVNQEVTKRLQQDLQLQRKRLNQLDQYGRRENLVLSGIPPNATGVDIKAIQLFHKIGVNVYPTQISACHPMKKEGNYILRFTNRKLVEEILKNGRKLGDTDSTEIWGENIIHSVYPNLSPTYLRLRYLAKKLKQLAAIERFGSSMYGVWVQEGDGDKVQIDTEEDIARFLPEGTTISSLLSSNH